MTLSMHQASVPLFVRGLESLAAVLKKGEEDAVARGIEPSVFLNARLAPDMFPLVRQVQIATDGVKGCIGRLAGIDIPVYADTEASFPELQDRIARTVAFLQSVPADKVDGSEDRPVVLKMRSGEMTFTGQPYLLHFVIPNFFFHATAAYAILRHNGVALAKLDFLGGI